MQQITSKTAAKIGLVWITFILYMLATNALAGTLAGRVVRVIDGDTVVLLPPDKKQVRIRLAEIDSPEKKQPWGKKAKKALSERIAGKKVQVQVTGKDRYQRLIGRIYLGERDINYEMVSSGNAWAFRKYLRDPELLSAEREARTEKRGLWALPEKERIPPWEWRRRQRQAQKH